MNGDRGGDAWFTWFRVRMKLIFLIILICLLYQINEIYIFKIFTLKENLIKKMLMMILREGCGTIMLQLGKCGDVDNFLFFYKYHNFMFCLLHNNLFVSYKLCDF